MNAVLAKGILGVVPYFGSLISEGISAVVPGQRADRLASRLREDRAELLALRGRIDVIPKTVDHAIYRYRSPTPGTQTRAYIRVVNQHSLEIVQALADVSGVSSARLDSKEKGFSIVCIYLPAAAAAVQEKIAFEALNAAQRFDGAAIFWRI